MSPDPIPDARPAVWHTAPDSLFPHVRMGAVSPDSDFVPALLEILNHAVPLAACATSAPRAAPVFQTCSHAILDLLTVDNTEELARLVAGSQAQVLVVMPDGLKREQQTEVRQTPGVQQAVVRSDLDAALTRLLHAGPEPAAAPARGPREDVPARGVAGWRSIAVWSLEGGIGRTMVTLALGLDCAARGHRALTLGLGAPDMLPLQAGLNPEPNLTAWLQNPRQEALRDIVQSQSGLDLLAGFLSPPALSRFAAQALAGEASLEALVMQAARLGYASVLMDVSAQELAVPALKAANTLVLVSSATAQGAVAAVEAYRLARHEIQLPAESCHLVLNRCRPGQFKTPEFTETVRRALRDMPEPVLALPEDPAGDTQGLRMADGERGAGHALRENMRALGDRLFGPTEPSRLHADSVKSFGPFTFRIGRT